MPKVTLATLSSLIGNENSAIAAINNNFANIRDEFDNVLSLDGESPSTMAADLDLDSNDILNANEIDAVTLDISGNVVIDGTLTVAGTDLASLYAATVVAKDAAVFAQTSAENAASNAQTHENNSATNASNAADSAAAALANSTNPALGFEYDLSSTSGTGIAAGQIRFNHLTISSATEAYVHFTDVEGNDMEAEILSWDDTGSTNRGKLYVTNSLDGSLVIFKVNDASVDNSTYATIKMVVVSGAITPADEDTLVVFHSPPGTASEVVDDTTPQLGGDLDLNGNNIDFPTTPNISDVLDDDTFATASATTLATSESIKAYADSVVPSAAEIKTAYESNADTNVFDDDAVSKLAGIEDSATADQTAQEIATAIDADGTAESTLQSALDIASLTVLASTANGDGAALVGVEDSAANFSATTVEGVLAELAGGSTSSVLTGVQIFTSSGTYTPSANTAVALVIVQAAGGGGGGVGTTSGTGRGGGGGAGETRMGVVAISGTETVTIGGAGSGASAGNNAGGTASDTTFGAHITAKGGTGGSGSSGSGNASSGSTPTGSGGVAIPATRSAGSSASGMTGGSCLFGLGGLLSDPTVSQGVGQSGSGKGGGGSGCVDTGTTARGGGAGAGGMVLVVEYR